MNWKQKIKRYIPLLPFLKTQQYKVLEILRPHWTFPNIDSPYQFRQANYEQDFQEITALFPLSFVSYFCTTDKEKILFLQKRFDTNVPCFIVRNDNEFIGFLWIAPTSDTYWVTNLFVSGQFRGRKIAQQLLSFAVSKIFESLPIDSIKSLILNDNIASLNTHLHTGFTIIGDKTTQRIGSISLEKYRSLK